MRWMLVTRFSQQWWLVVNSPMSPVTPMASMSAVVTSGSAPSR